MKYFPAKCIVLIFIFVNASLFSQPYHWVKAASGTQKDLYYVTNIISSSISKFYAVGDSGVLLASTDRRCSEWEVIPTGFRQKLFGLTKAKDTFVAVGSDGTILTSSPDNSHWIQQTSGSRAQLTSVIWKGDKFIAVGDSGTILTSGDGQTWVKRSVNKKFS
jgi:photosystem II stability/assembly factor-like uncharacterized protein